MLKVGDTIEILQEGLQHARVNVGERFVVKKLLVGKSYDFQVKVPDGRNDGTYSFGYEHRGEGWILVQDDIKQYFYEGVNV